MVYNDDSDAQERKSSISFDKIKQISLTYSLQSEDDDPSIQDVGQTGPIGKGQFLDNSGFANEKFGEIEVPKLAASTQAMQNVEGKRSLASANLRSNNTLDARKHSLDADWSTESDYDDPGLDKQPQILNKTTPNSQQNTTNPFLFYQQRDATKRANVSDISEDELSNQIEVDHDQHQGSTISVVFSKNSSANIIIEESTASNVSNLDSSGITHRIINGPTTKANTTRVFNEEAAYEENYDYDWNLESCDHSNVLMGNIDYRNVLDSTPALVNKQKRDSNARTLTDISGQCGGTSDAYEAGHQRSSSLFVEDSSETGGTLVYGKGGEFCSRRQRFAGNGNGCYDQETGDCRRPVGAQTAPMPGAPNHQATSLTHELDRPTRRRERTPGGEPYWQREQVPSSHSGSADISQLEQTQASRMFNEKRGGYFDEENDDSLDEVAER